jgi:hypothetical protein
MKNLDAYLHAKNRYLLESTLKAIVCLNQNLLDQSIEHFKTGANLQDLESLLCLIVLFLSIQNFSDARYYIRVVNQQIPQLPYSLTAQNHIHHC